MSSDSGSVAAGPSLTRRSLARGVAGLGLSGLGLSGLGATAGCTVGSRSTRLIVTGRAGSSTDRLARLFARHATRLFGVAIKVENEPRSYGVVTAQRLAAAGARETLALFQNGVFYTALWRPERVDLSRFQWIGGASADKRALVAGPHAAVDRFEDLTVRRRPLVVISAPVGGSGWFEARILAHLTRARVRIVPGFDGAVRNLALLSGEGEATIGSVDSLAPVLEAPGARLLLRVGASAPGLSAEAADDGAPRLDEVAVGPDAGPLLQLIANHALFGRPFAMNGDASPDTVALWRERFRRVMADPDFLREARAGGHLIQPVDGPGLERILEPLHPARRARFAEALTRALGPE